jgi:adenylate cyclase
MDDDAPLHRIRCAPDAAEIPAAPGQTILDAMLAAGVPAAHACGGLARCSTCRVRVTDGAERCDGRTESERVIADRLRFDDETRLACQTRVRGDIGVRRLVVDAQDVALAAGEAKASVARAVGREATLTLLFTDVADFTPLAEELPPYDVIHLLNRWFTAAGEVVARHHGRMDNYMGDGFFAVFGDAGGAGGTDGEVSADDDALDAVRAGLGLVEVAAQVSRYAEAIYGRGFGVRVGIHRGTVVVGGLGAASMMRETVIGDAVNVAARIEAANKPAGTKLLVSDAVADRVASAVVFGRSVDAELKGKTGAHHLREVTGLR